MFRLTKQADYGIVLMARLAGAPGERFAAADLAAETLIPGPTVSKILKILTREGLLVSYRGAKGGYTLSKDPPDISVAEMICALDGPIAFTDCIEGAPGECSQEDVCGMRYNWQAINNAVRTALEGISLADLTHPMIQPSQPLVQLGGGFTPGDRA